MNQERINEVVQEILKGMSETDKEIVRTTPKDDLISSLHSWGARIRNTYQLWHDPELVKATGTEHPDDASMVIIEAVWERLQGK